MYLATLQYGEKTVYEIRQSYPVDKCNTYKSEIAKNALDLGVDMINDISALQADKNLANIVAEYEVPICLMHMKGNPKSMQINPVYDDVVKEIYDFLFFLSNTESNNKFYVLFYGIIIKRNYIVHFLVLLTFPDRL